MQADRSREGGWIVGGYCDGIRLIPPGSNEGARIAPLQNPSYLALSADHRVLYAAAENQSGTIEALIRNGDGHWGSRASVPSGGDLPCHIGLSPCGRMLAVANYLSGGVSVFPILRDGSLASGRPLAGMTHASGAVPGRQKAPHAHAAHFSPDGARLLVPDLGADRLYLFARDGAAWVPHAPQAWLELPPGSGPRHAAFSPDGRCVLVLNELSNTLVDARLGADGILRIVDERGTLPPSFEGASSAAELAFHPSGRTLAASNRGSDSLAFFRWDAERGLSGSPEFLQVGATPRHFAFHPDGASVAVAAQDADRIEIHALDARLGMPLRSAAVRVSRAPRPSCVLHLRPLPPS